MQKDNQGGHQLIRAAAALRYVKCYGKFLWLCKTNWQSI